MAKRTSTVTPDADTTTRRRDSKKVVPHRKKKHPPVAPPITHNNRSRNTLEHGHAGLISASSENESQLGSVYRGKIHTKIPRYGQQMPQLYTESFSDESSEDSVFEWDLKSFETTSVTQLSTAESSFQGQASTWEHESFVSRGSITKYVSNIKHSVTEMENFLRRGDSQANLLTGYDDDDDLDNELRDLADIEKELHDEMEGFLVGINENEDDSSRDVAAAFSVYLERGSRKDSFELSDLDDSYHGLRMNHSQRSLDRSNFEMNKENSNGSSVSIIKMKVKRNSLPHLGYSNLGEAYDEFRPMALVTSLPPLRRRSKSASDGMAMPPSSAATKLFPNLAQIPSIPKTVHKRQSSDFYQLPSALSHEQKSRLSSIISVGDYDSADEGSTVESGTQKIKRPSKFEIHRTNSDATILSPSSVKVLQNIATPIQSNLTVSLSKDSKLARKLTLDFSRERNSHPSIEERSDTNTTPIQKLARNRTASQLPPQSGSGKEHSMPQEDTILSTTTHLSPPHQRNNDRFSLTTSQGTPAANILYNKQTENNSLYQPKETGPRKTSVRRRSLEVPSLPVTEQPSRQTKQELERSEDQDKCGSGISVRTNKIAKSVFCSHEYKVVPFFSSKKDVGVFTRTYEGSFMVYLASWIAISFLHGTIPHHAFWMVALVIPMTVAFMEINLPHSIDEVTIALGIISLRFAAEKCW